MATERRCALRAWLDAQPWISHARRLAVGGCGVLVWVPEPLPDACITPARLARGERRILLLEKQGRGGMLIEHQPSTTSWRLLVAPLPSRDEAYEALLRLHPFAAQA